jgi:LysR family cys regulon transcriptional activator
MPIQRYKDLQLAQLRAFCACVRHGSFSAAARALQMSQPAVWQQVRALERHFGVGLLQRVGRGLEPSEDGRLLLEQAASILGNVDSMRQVFERQRRDVPRTLVVIGSPGVIAEELAQPVADFCRRHPTIRLTLLSYAGLRSLDLLIAGDADLAVLPLAADVGSHRQLLVWEHLCEREWVLIVPRRHPLARKRRPTLAEITRYPLILPEKDSNWRKQVEARFLAAGLLDKLRVVLEVSITLAARRYVSLGLGIALLPLPREGLEFPGTVVRPLGNLLPPEPIVMFWRRGSTPRPQARLFADAITTSMRITKARKYESTKKRGRW